MAKISARLLKELLEGKTGKEISHILAMIQFTNEKGMVEGGAYWKAMRAEALISMRHHYNFLNSLSDKGIYEIQPDGSIKISLNDFTVDSKNGKPDYSKNNYIELPDFIYSHTFKAAPVLLKRLVLYFLSCGIKSHAVEITEAKLLEKLNLNRPSKLLDAFWLLSQMGFFNYKAMYSEKSSAFKIYKYIIGLKEEFSKSRPFNHSKTSENSVRNILVKKRIKFTPNSLSKLTFLFNIYKLHFIKALKYLNQATANIIYHPNQTDGTVAFEYWLRDVKNNILN